MTLTINDTAPDFTAAVDRRGDQLPRLDRRLVGGALLASQGLHAGLHDGARLHGEDQARVRPAQREDHRHLGRLDRRPRGLGEDIEETQGTAPNYPIIGDADFKVSKMYGMLPAEVGGEAADRTAADNQTVRNVFVIGPDKKVKLVLVYPMTTGRNFDEVLRVIDSLQLTAKHRVATPVNWQQGDKVIIAGSVSNDEAKEIWPDGWESPEAVHPDRRPARVGRPRGEQELESQDRSAAQSVRPRLRSSRASGISAIKSPRVAGS